MKSKFSAAGARAFQMSLVMFASGMSASVASAGIIEDCPGQILPVVVSKIPRLAGPIDFPVPKAAWMDGLAKVSTSLFPHSARSAIAPLGGTKITPFRELNLDELTIVGNLYPGTPEEISSAFTSRAEDLRNLTDVAGRAGSLSSNTMTEIPAGAQIIARLRAELGAENFSLTYLAPLGKQDLAKWRTRTMEPEEEGLVTLFQFTVRGKPMKLHLVSGYVLADSTRGTRDPFPSVTRATLPSDGATWLYLSADGVAFFSRKTDNGLRAANEQALDFLKPRGAVVLDYPTSPYATGADPQEFGGITAMMGRRPLESDGLKRIATLPAETSGLFGYCLKKSDEVRVYRKRAAAVSTKKTMPVDLYVSGRVTFEMAP